MLKPTRKIEVKCGGCGVAIVRKPSAIRSVVVYCSHKCRASIQLSDSAAQRSISQLSRDRRVERACGHCGAEFSSREKANRKFCSPRCSQLAHSQNSQESSTCLQCEKVFTLPKSLVRRDRRFCTRSCWSTYRTTGERNQNWKGGISSERDVIKATDEYKEWRLSVFRRDHFMCVVCLNGSTGDNPIEAHHLKKFSDHPELATDVENGSTLCRKCHKQTYNCEELVESFLRTRILRDFTSDMRVPMDMLKIKSGLRGDTQKAAEMTASAA